MRLVVAEITLHEMSNIQETFFRTLPGIAGIKTFKADLIVCFKILKGFTDVIPTEFFCSRHPVLEVKV